MLGTSSPRRLWSAPIFVALLLMVAFAHAQTQTGVLDDVTDRFQAAAAQWATTIQSAATYLFWSLALISMVWTFGTLALRQADLSEFFMEFIKFLVFTGFYFWLLTNAPAIATAILNSMKQLGSNAGGSSGLTPSGIVEVGFKVFDKVVDASTIRDIPASLAGIAMGAVVLCVLGLVAINMVVLLISAWILAYAGIFWLGFGGARWTNDIAINYYKTVLATGGALLAMILLVGIGQTFINDYFARLSTVSLREMAVMLIASIVLLVLTNKIPSLVGGIVTGGSIGAAAAMGQAGTGTLMAAGAVMGAAAAAAVGGAASLATRAAGWGSAASAALERGGTADSAGSIGAMPSSMGGGASSNGAGASAASDIGSPSPLAASMGDAGSAAGAPADGEDTPRAVAEPPTPSGEGEGPGASSSPSQATPPRSALGALGAGIASVAKAHAGMAMDAARLRVSQTTGGRVAEEIRNPGSAEQLRQHTADIAQSQTVQGRAAAARAFASGGVISGAAAGANGSVPPLDSAAAQAEIDAFANRKS